MLAHTIMEMNIMTMRTFFLFSFDMFNLPRLFSYLRKNKSVYESEVSAKQALVGCRRPRFDIEASHRVTFPTTDFLLIMVCKLHT